MSSRDRPAQLARKQTCPVRRRAIAEWLMSLPENANSARAYRFAVCEWIDWATENSVDWLNPRYADAKQYGQDLVLRVHRNTVSVRMAGIRQFYGSLIESGVTTNGVFFLVGFGHERRQSAGYHPAEVQALWNAACPTDRVSLLLLTENGMRSHQIVKLGWSNVTHDHRITLGAQSWPLSERAAECIHRLPRRTGRLLGFGTTERLRNRFRKLAARAKVEYRGVDVLRRYAA